MMFYDHEIAMYGVEGAAKRKRCGRLGVYIDGLDKCVYPAGGYANMPDGPSIPTASSSKQTPSQVPTPQQAAKAISQELMQRKTAKS